MTLIEAINSGKRFKRPHWYEWKSRPASRFFDVDDILADDWITEDETVTVTRKQVEDLIRTADWAGTEREYIERFCKELGFKE